MVQNWATAVAVLLGGVWAYYRFGIKRESETALGIKLTHTSVSYQPDWLVVFDVCIQNKGAVRIGAKRQRKPAYDDETELVAYAADLLLRPVPPGSAPGSQVRWFADETDRSPRPGDIEVDLVAEYVIKGETDFWMEPGESYHLGSAVVLPSGSYLAMVTFAGDRSDEEFWRRLFLVQVPDVRLPASQPAAKQRLHPSAAARGGAGSRRSGAAAAGEPHAVGRTGEARLE